MSSNHVETQRLTSLRAYGILNTPPEAAFDDLAGLAAQLCQTPIAVLGFIDAERYWVKANFGFKLDAVPRASTLYPPDGAAALVVVPDTLEDERLSQHPMVMLWPKVRFYMGAPILSPAGELMGVLEVLDRVPRQLDEHQKSALAALARQVQAQLELRRAAAERAVLLDKAERSEFELSVAYDATLETMARALDLRDKEAEGHLLRVAAIAVRLAEVMGVPQADLKHVHRGALLHDIGKMTIPDSILLKPGALTDEEWVIMHQHPTHAYEMLLPIGLLKPALDIPYCHHERWDGKGYPRGIEGEQIPLAARLFSVVDVWDALRSDRPYRVGWSEMRAREYIAGRSGADFDPVVVDAFLKLPQ